MRMSASDVVPRQVVAFVPDLMDRSRLIAPGVEVVFVEDPVELADADADLVVVDLSRPGAIEALGAVVGPIMGFAAHVDEATMAAGIVAGCDEVLARSRFFRRFAEMAAGPDAYSALASLHRGPGSDSSGCQAVLAPG